MTNTLTLTRLSAQDYADLKAAAASLEGSSLAMTIATKAGMPMEALMRLLPERSQAAISMAVDKAHTLTTAVTGAVGGFFGLPGMLVELPVTTTVMLHSIAAIAAAQGEDLSQPESALSCLEVLALGPQGKHGEAYESAYYATRAALAQVTRDAAAYVAQQGLAKEGAPVLISFLSKVASRFGLEVSEKAAAQLIPVAGAAGGLALNVLFTSHFQQLAHGHFTVRRLERKYGSEIVRREYDLARPASARIA
jgi:hypothetical protein